MLLREIDHEDAAGCTATARNAAAITWCESEPSCEVTDARDYGGTPQEQVMCAPRN